MKILIIRFSSIGDIVLTTPVIRCLKNQIGAEIHYLTKQNFRGIVASNPYVSRVWTIEKSVSEIIFDLKKEQFDIVIDLHKNLRSCQIKFALGVRSFSFYKQNVLKWLAVNFKMNSLPPVHIVDRYLKTVEKLGVKNDGQGLDFFIPEADEVDISSLVANDLRLTINDSPLKFIAFVIGAAHATKRLPTVKIIEICNQIRLPIVLLGGKEDTSSGALIDSESTSYVVNLCGKLNLNQSASVVRQATKVITHDTGLMHIAAAFGKDILSVWGNTIPEFGMTPYLPTANSKQFEVKNLPCRPCSKIGFAACPKGHFDCMNRQNTEGIAEAANANFKTN